MDFDGTAAVIAGADTPLGRIAAVSLASRGAALVLAGRESDALDAVHDEVVSLGATSEMAIGRPSDASLADRCATLAEAADRPRYVLINAWGGGEAASLDAIDEATWDDTIDSGVKAAFSFTRQLSKTMIASGGGRVVSIGLAAAHLGRERSAHLSAVATALSSLTRTAAIELGKFQITVNAVAVGDVDWNAGDGAPRSLPPTTPLRRAAAPSEIADVVLFLASPGASYLTGETVYVAGGQQLVPALVLEPSPTATGGGA